jgi:hypothetical protein
VIRAKQGMALDLGAGTRLELIDDADGNLTFLLTAGMARIAFIPRSRSSDVFAQPELASLSGIILPESLAVRWLEEVEVVVAVIDGPNPLPSVASRPDLLATGERGWIELVTDGEQLWIWTQRSGSEN